MAEQDRSRSPESYRVKIGVDDYHDAMSRLGSAVSIVTTHGPAGRCGLTVSSVTSVSDDPPIVLICVNKLARTCRILSENGVFAINVLAVGSEALSNAFAGRGEHSVEERFALAEWHHCADGAGAPLLRDSRVSIDCEVIDRMDSGNHRVFFGAVKALYFGRPAPALLYVDRAYKSVDEQ